MKIFFAKMVYFLDRFRDKVKQSDFMKHWAIISGETAQIYYLEILNERGKFCENEIPILSFRRAFQRGR